MYCCEHFKQNPEEHAQNDSFRSRGGEFWTPVLWLSSQWAPCCSIVLSCGWMRQGVAAEATAASVTCHTLLVHSLPLRNAADSPLRRSHQQAGVLIVPQGAPLILPITSFISLSMTPPTSFPPVGPDPDRSACGWLRVRLEEHTLIIKLRDAGLEQKFVQADGHLSVTDLHTLPTFLPSKLLSSVISV